MPSAEAALYSLLTAGSPNPVAALVGSRVWPDALPQAPVLPAIRYQRISTGTSPYRTLEDHDVSPRMQVDCYAASRLAAIELAQAVRQVVRDFRGTIGGLRIDNISKEDERGDTEPGVIVGGALLYRQGVDLFIYHAE